MEAFSIYIHFYGEKNYASFIQFGVQSEQAQKTPKVNNYGIGQVPPVNALTKKKYKMQGLIHKPSFLNIRRFEVCLTKLNKYLGFFPCTNESKKWADLN